MKLDEEKPKEEKAGGSKALIVTEESDGEMEYWSSGSEDEEVLKTTRGSVWKDVDATCCMAKLEKARADGTIPAQVRDFLIKFDISASEYDPLLDEITKDLEGLENLYVTALKDKNKMDSENLRINNLNTKYLSLIDSLKLRVSILENENTHVEQERILMLKQRNIFCSTAKRLYAKITDIYHSSAVSKDQHRKLLPFFEMSVRNADALSYECEKMIPSDCVLDVSFRYGVVVPQPLIASDEYVKYVSETLTKAEFDESAGLKQQVEENRVEVVDITTNESVISEVAKNQMSVESIENEIVDVIEETEEVVDEEIIVESSDLDSSETVFEQLDESDIEEIDCSDAVVNCCDEISNCSDEVVSCDISILKTDDCDEFESCVDGSEMEYTKNDFDSSDTYYDTSSGIPDSFSTIDSTEVLDNLQNNLGKASLFEKVIVYPRVCNAQNQVYKQAGCSEQFFDAFTDLVTKDNIKTAKEKCHFWTKQYVDSRKIDYTKHTWVVKGTSHDFHLTHDEDFSYNKVYASDKSMDSNSSADPLVANLKQKSQKKFTNEKVKKKPNDHSSTCDKKMTSLDFKAWMIEIKQIPPLRHLSVYEITQLHKEFLIYKSSFEISATNPSVSVDFSYPNEFSKVENISSSVRQQVHTPAGSVNEQVAAFKEPSSPIKVSSTFKKIPKNVNHKPHFRPHRSQYHNSFPRVAKGFGYSKTSYYYNFQSFSSRSNPRFNSYSSSHSSHSSWKPNQPMNRIPEALKQRLSKSSVVIFPESSGRHYHQPKSHWVPKCL
ncbi:hypothetical protein E9993_22550 [Labilibacter sediminis]|nr:hypothetical protein E9993_22550 [Labilibacter sediminis]